MCDVFWILLGLLLLILKSFWLVFNWCDQVELPNAKLRLATPKQQGIQCNYNQLCVLVCMCVLHWPWPQSTVRDFCWLEKFCYTLLPGNINPQSILMHLKLSSCTLSCRVFFLAQERMSGSSWEEFKDMRRELWGDITATTVWFDLPHHLSLCRVWVKLVQFRQSLGLYDGCEAGFRLTWHLKGPAVLLTAHL